MSLLLIFLLQVFVSSPSLSNLNLCIGHDGHMEIESKGSECCPTAPWNEAGTTLSVEQGACESCLDVSLGEAQSSTIAPAHALALQGFFPSRTVLETLEPLRLNRFAFLDRGNPIEPALEAIRSTVLRV